MKFLQSMLIWVTLSSAGVGGGLSTVVYQVQTSAFYQEIAEHFVLLLAHALYGDVNFRFQLGFLPTLPTLPPHHLILLIGQPTCLMLIPLEIYKLL